MSRMMEKVKEVEKENFDGNIYNEIGKNKARVEIVRLDSIIPAP